VTGRIALGFEIEPHFCGRIIERLKVQYSLRAKIVGSVFDCKSLPRAGKEFLTNERSSGQCLKLPVS
jgi:hypothetical protein